MTNSNKKKVTRVHGMINKEKLLKIIWGKEPFSQIDTWTIASTWQRDRVSD